MQKTLIFIVILGASIWWLLPDVKQSKWVPVIPALQDTKPTVATLKAARHPVGTALQTVAPVKEPYFIVTYLHDLSFSVVPANSHFYELENFQDQKLEISLHNFQEYDSVQMWGSDTQEILPAKMVFDWTQKELDRANFEGSFFKDYKFYRLQWNSLLTKESRRAHFLFAAEKNLSPGFKITYQPLDAGTKVADLTYSQTVGEESKSQLPPLQLRKNSMLGFKFDLSRHKLLSCEYMPPQGQLQDCTGWAHSDYVGSVDGRDVGRHRIRMTTDRGPFSFELEINQIH